MKKYVIAFVLLFCFANIEVNAQGFLRKIKEKATAKTSKGLNDDQTDKNQTLTNTNNVEIDTKELSRQIQLPKSINTGSASSSNSIEEIKKLIKQGYVDSNFSKLYTNLDGEKIYKFEDEENIAFQGRACWKTEMQYLMFGDDNSMGIITAVTFDLITPDGGHGKRVYKAGPKGDECRYILVKGIIYKWKKEDYSDLHEYLLFDSDKNILTSIDKKLTYNLVNKDFDK